jgi:hypothetical protein
MRGGRGKGKDTDEGRGLQYMYMLKDSIMKTTKHYLEKKEERENETMYGITTMKPPHIINVC